MFEKASRLKLRFESVAGLLSVEDLWDLPLTSEKRANLDDIAKNISRQLKASQDESFVVKATTGNELLQLKLEVVKYVIAVLLEERTIAATAREKKEKKQQIMAIIDRKKNEQLEQSSIDDLEKMLEAV